MMIVDEDIVLKILVELILFSLWNHSWTFLTTLFHVMFCFYIYFPFAETWIGTDSSFCQFPTKHYPVFDRCKWPYNNANVNVVLMFTKVTAVYQRTVLINLCFCTLTDAGTDWQTPPKNGTLIGRLTIGKIEKGTILMKAVHVKCHKSEAKHFTMAVQMHLQSWNNSSFIHSKFSSIQFGLRIVS